MQLPKTVPEKYSATYGRMVEKYGSEALAELHTLKALKLSGVYVRGLAAVQENLLKDMLRADAADIAKYLKGLRSFRPELLHVGQDDRGAKQLVYGTYKLQVVKGYDYSRALDTAKFVPSRNKPPQLVRPVKTKSRVLAKDPGKNGWYPLPLRSTLRWYLLLSADGLLLRYELDVPSNFIVVPKNVLIKVWKKL